MLGSAFIAMRKLSPVGRLGWVRASVGALLGILVTGSVAQLWLGSSTSLPILIAPIGASAVLLFAVPASPLAQPWSIFGGNSLSALAGVASAMLVDDPTAAAGLAVALAVALMSAARCLHPPGGAVALTAVIGGPAIAAAGWSFALVPVALNSIILLGIGWLFNNATRHSYPHRVRAFSHTVHETSDQAPQDRVGYTAADIDAVLARYDELLDVSRDDLDAIFRQVEAHAYRRIHGEIRCDRIMSRDIIYATPNQGVGEARDRLLKNRLSAMPVIDEQRRVAGLIHHSDLLAGAGRTVGEVMEASPCIASPDTPIDQLLPLLSGGVFHEALITDPNLHLLGMITQTDLLAAVWRGHVAEQVVASNGASEEGGSVATTI